MAGMALALAAFAQEIIEPRPIPRLAEEQREVQRFIRLANHCSATYTEAAGAIGQGGWVRVQFTISTEGEHRTSGNRLQSSWLL